MAHFYGTVKGQRGEASRLGSKQSRLETVAASWQGSVRVYLYHDDETGNDMARVSLQPWQGEGTSATVYDGPVSGAGRVLTVDGQRVTTGEGDVIAARVA